MAELTEAAPEQVGGRPGRSIGTYIRATEIDLRLFGMVVALIAILAGFGLLTGGRILSPSSLTTMSVQFATTAIMATGMVLIIVSRNIDLSVGSVSGLLAMTYAVLMTDWLPYLTSEVPALGLERGSPMMWIAALAIGLALGVAIGGLQGFIIAYIGVPSFIVTLGGLLAFRGLVWVFSHGAAVSGLDSTFLLLGGGAQGSLGWTMTWVVALVGCLGIVGLLAYNRRQRQRFGFAVRPMWAEVLLGVVGCAVVLIVAAEANANTWPPRLAERFAQQQGIEIADRLPENCGLLCYLSDGIQIGLDPKGVGDRLLIPVGFPWPIAIVIGVTLVMTFIATRRRFGRYVYAYGGNPEAAELAGINTRWTVMKLFMLMGMLSAIAGAIAVARLNSATLDIGRSDELYVIAAAVVGGTSFAGGIGTIPGAVLGAIVMQSLNYGLAYMGVETAVREIVAGVVLVVAVGFDTWNRRRAGA
jgi:D-xylose transport system permease protein